MSALDSAEPCIACGAPILSGTGHDPGCMLDDAPAPWPLTPAELAELQVIRCRALADAGDSAPMYRVSYTPQPTNGRAVSAFSTSRTVIPWLDALNLEVDQ